jgi:hypothetical protein
MIVAEDDDIRWWCIMRATEQKMIIADDGDTWWRCVRRISDYDDIFADIRLLYSAAWANQCISAPLPLLSQRLLYFKFFINFLEYVTYTRGTFIQRFTLTVKQHKQRSVSKSAFVECKKECCSCSREKYRSVADLTITLAWAIRLLLQVLVLVTLVTWVQAVCLTAARVKRSAM